MLYNFVSAQEMARKHPDTFQAPSLEECATLKPGDYVKVCIAKERFWVQITEIPSSGVPSIVGKVANELIFSHVHGYQFGDKISFGFHNVFQTQASAGTKMVDSEEGNIGITHVGCNG